MMDGSLMPTLVLIADQRTACHEYFLWWSVLTTLSTDIAAPRGCPYELGPRLTTLRLNNEQLSLTLRVRNAREDMNKFTRV